MKYAANVSSSRRKSRKVSSHHLPTDNRACIVGLIFDRCIRMSTSQACAAPEPS
jgi:hypothetical protein